MTLINLSQRYLETCSPPFYERVLMRAIPEVYSASSLSAIGPYFRANPPRKITPLTSCPTAAVLVRSVKIKIIYPDSFDENDWRSMRGLDLGLNFPAFELKDETMETATIWRAGNSRNYLKAKKEFGFNQESYVDIPRAWLEYRHFPPNDSYFIIRHLESHRKPRRQTKTLKERLLELIPEFPTVEPQPAF